MKKTIRALTAVLLALCMLVSSAGALADTEPEDGTNGPENEIRPDFVLRISVAETEDGSDGAADGTGADMPGEEETDAAEPVEEDGEPTVAEETEADTADNDGVLPAEDPAPDPETADAGEDMPGEEETDAAEPVGEDGEPTAAEETEADTADNDGVLPAEDSAPDPDTSGEGAEADMPEEETMSAAEPAGEETVPAAAEEPEAAAEGAGDLPAEEPEQDQETAGADIPEEENMNAVEPGKEDTDPAVGEEPEAAAEETGNLSAEEPVPVAAEEPEAAAEGGAESGAENAPASGYTDSPVLVTAEGTDTVTVEVPGDLSTGDPSHDPYIRTVGIDVHARDESAASVTVDGDLSVTGYAGWWESGAVFTQTEGKGQIDVEITGRITSDGLDGIDVYTDRVDGGQTQVRVGGDVTVTDGDDDECPVYGVYAGNHGAGEDTISIGGDVEVTSKDNAHGVVLVSYSDSGFIEAEVEGGITAEADEHAYGIYAESSGTAVDVRVGGDVTASGETAKGMELETTGTGEISVEVGGDISASGTAAGYETHGICAGARDESRISVAVGGDVRAEGKDPGEAAVDVEVQGQSAASVTVEGDVSATGLGGVYTFDNDDDGGKQIDIQVGGNITVEDDSENPGYICGLSTDNCGHAKTGVSVGGDISVTVTGEKDAYGIYAQTELTDGHTTISAGGSVSAVSTGDGSACGISTDNSGGGYITITVDGDVTAAGSDATGIDVFNWGKDRTETGATEIRVAGDVRSEGTGLMLDLEYSQIQTDIIIDGTLSGGEHAVVLMDEQSQERFDGIGGDCTLTVWKIDPTEDGAVAEALTVKPDAAGESWTEEYLEDEEAEKKIQYIIRVEQPTAGARLSTLGTMDYEGYQVAHEGDQVILKVELEAGYELVAAYEGTDVKIELMKDDDGNSYLVIPRGGGVLLSVELRAAGPAGEPVVRQVRVTVAEWEEDTGTVSAADYGTMGIAEAVRALADAEPGAHIEVVGLERVMDSGRAAAVRRLPETEQVTILLCAAGLGSLQDLGRLSADARSLAAEAQDAFSALPAGEQEKLLAMFAAKVEWNGQTVDGYRIELLVHQADGSVEHRRLSFVEDNGRLVLVRTELKKP